jgi:hypothetical protein
MMTQILCQTQTRRRKKKLKIDRKKNCPSCGSDNLCDVVPEQICLDCDWLSAAESVAKGKMDNLHEAFLEHFCDRPTIAEKISKDENQTTKPQKTGAA